MTFACSNSVKELLCGDSFLLQPWLSKVVEKLPDDQKDEFKAKAQPAFKFLLGKIKELQLWVPILTCSVGTKTGLLLLKILFRPAMTF